jgi:SPX domain protein involved in polyphosphate accumulation
MSFRFELKFALRKEKIPELKNYLDKLKIVKNFPPRLINSIYFDNNKYQSFEDSEEGISPRKKIRLRYYNNDKNLIFFEKKINSYEGRFKESNSINLIEYKKKIKILL